MEAAVKNGRRTLSAEIEHRLRRSFIDDKTIQELFGDRRVHALVMIIAQTLQMKHRWDKPKADWLLDRWLFDQVVLSVNAVLEAFQPPGPSIPPTNPYGIDDPEHYAELSTPEYQRHLARERVAAELDAIHKANPLMPPSATGKASRRNRRKAGLGDLTQRAWDLNTPGMKGKKGDS
jgi:hypothetical protein